MREGRNKQKRGKERNESIESKEGIEERKNEERKVQRKEWKRNDITKNEIRKEKKWRNEGINIKRKIYEIQRIINKRNRIAERRKE